MRLTPYRSVLVVGGTLLAVSVLAAIGASYVYKKQVWAEAKLAELEPRYARLQGLVIAEKSLKAASADVAKRIGTTTYPASLEVDRASGELQQRIKKIFEEASVTVVTNRVLEPKPGKDFDLISVSFSVNTSLANLQAALARVRTEAPFLKVDEFVLLPVRRQLAWDPQLVTCTMTISALRKKS
ncbi:MAG: hypothetical protein IPO35_15755 [Uliginosibacterium sp.]|nr:hypothetical protein [Uliginosibacterium sp.]